MRLNLDALEPVMDFFKANNLIMSSLPDWLPSAIVPIHNTTSPQHSEIESATSGQRMKVFRPIPIDGKSSLEP